MSPADSPSRPDDKPQQQAPASSPEASSELLPEQEALREQIVEQLRTVYDPEIPVNIYELGLIYLIDVQPEGKVNVRMTLTSPACPVAGILPGQVQSKVASVDGVNEAEVELVWDPPWNPDMMSEAARLQLNL